MYLLLLIPTDRKLVLMHVYGVSSIIYLLLQIVYIQVVYTQMRR